MIFDKNLDSNFRIFDKKVILKVSSFLCETSNRLVISESFKTIVKLSIRELKRRNSILLDMFGTKDVTDSHIDTLLKALEYLTILPIEKMVKLLPNSEYPIWWALFVPAKTPRDVTDKLHRDTLKAIQAPGLSYWAVKGQKRARISSRALKKRMRKKKK